MNNKTIAIIFGCLVTTGCTPTVWDKSGATPEQFNVENARCRLLARGANPGDFAAVGSPSFVAGAAVGNAIGTAVATNATYRDCMIASGYTAENPQIAAKTQPIKAIGDAAANCGKLAYFAPAAAPLRRHGAFLPTDLTQANLADSSFADAEDVAALQWVRPQYRQCRQTALEQLTPIAPRIADVFRDEMAATEQRSDALAARHMTWGQYNTARKDGAAAFTQRVQAAAAQ